MEPIMPLIRISMQARPPGLARPPPSSTASTVRCAPPYEVPEKDLFAVVHQHDAEEFIFDQQLFRVPAQQPGW
jgi:4-oxalocrotonate tautomerase